MEFILLQILCLLKRNAITISQAGHGPDSSTRNFDFLSHLFPVLILSVF